ncbi:MAG: GNAT family N-acetyltransferase [Treponema sp.]|nr:GNAT family N-acetyltransferase [Treponema sp.]
MAEYEFSFARRMADIDRAEWDALAERQGTPLLSWGFLALLEASGSMTPETGWSGAHLLVRRKGRPGLAAAAPFYVKTHSWGEFVFDFEFAELARRAGIAYYPKLVGMVPATPAPAWRVLTAPEEDEAGLGVLALKAAEQAAREAGLGGVHLLWPDAEFAAAAVAAAASAATQGGEAAGATAAEGGAATVADPAGAGRPRGVAGSDNAAAAGAATHGGAVSVARPESVSPWLRWDHQAFLWTDEGYGDFAGLLDSFSKNMRRNVKREREAVREAGIETRILAPAEAGPEVLDLLAELYESHNARFGPWAAQFLTRDFFLRLPEFMPSGWALSAAFDRGAATPFALAFLFEGRDRLYGRYWGTLREEEGLHFELCYYLPMEYALERGIRTFDPGMGSPHKARRGFRSILAPSFHRIFDPRVSRAVARYLPGANAREAEEAEALDRDLPYKRRSES